MFDFSRKDPSLKLYQRIKDHLHKHDCNYVTAHLTLLKGHDAGRRELVAFYLPDAGRRYVQFICLTGPDAHTGSTFGLDENSPFKLELVSDSVSLKFRQVTEASTCLLRAETITEEHQRLHMFVDATGTKWYFSNRSNVHEDRRNRGKTFVLHRDPPEGEKTPVCYRVFHTGLGHLYDGHWLFNTSPEHNPDYRYYVHESSIDKEARAKIDRMFPAKVREHMMLVALEKIGRHLNLPIGLEEYVKFCEDTLTNANLQKQAAKNDPQCYYTPSPVHQPLDEQRVGSAESTAGCQSAQGQDFSSCDETQDPG